MHHTLRVSSLAVLLLLAFFSTPFVFAQETDTPLEEPALETSAAPTNPGNRPLDAIKERAQQIKQNAQGVKPILPRATSTMEKRDAAKNALEERTDAARARMASTTDIARGIKALILMHGGQIKNRFHLAITHLENILTRVDTRLDKMKTAGIDVSSVETLNTNAKTALIKAESDAKAVAEYVASVSDSNDRTNVRKELQSKIAIAQDSLKKAHAAVKEVVAALTKLAKSNNAPRGSASSTGNTVQ